MADALCDRGIDVILDRYVHPGPAEGWPRWMERNLDAAQFVLMVCTETTAAVSGARRSRVKAPAWVGRAR